MFQLQCAPVPATLPPAAAMALLDCLSREHADELSRRLDRGIGLESVTGLALLAWCGRERPLPPLSALSRPAGGKPCWPGGPDFSISHAGGHAACAVAPPGIAIGIDLEPAGRLPPRALRLVLSDAEKHALAASADATAVWTCKEAIVKAAGARFADLRRAEVDGSQGRLDERHFHLQQLAPAADLLLAIASSKPLPPAAVRWLRPEELFPGMQGRSGL